MKVKMQLALLASLCLSVSQTWQKVIGESHKFSLIMIISLSEERLIAIAKLHFSSV